MIENQKLTLARDKKVVMNIIEKSLELKSSVVEIDETEKGERALLNFGHTFGHAVETANGYSKKIIHGEAVLIGMMVAAKLSYKLGCLSKIELNKIINLYKRLNLNF